MPNPSGSLCSILLTVNYTPFIVGIGLLPALIAALLLYRRQRGLLAVAHTNASHHTSQLLRMEAEYFKLLSEKEWLVREVQHRVKNNLQLVISLLHMQTAYLIEASALDAFDDISARIRAISIIHQRLYQEENYLSMINMKEYIPELVGSLESGPAATARAIGFRLDIGCIQLNISQSVSVGLILNEAITNSMKYAFAPAAAAPASPTPATTAATTPNDHLAPAPAATPTPTILITMQQQGDANIRLTIADNGIGLPKDFDPKTSALMGHQLIRTLSDQLEGELRWQNQNGLSLNLQFTRQQQSSGVSSYLH